MALPKELVADTRFYLNPEIIQNQTGPLPNFQILPKLAERISNQELITTALVLEKLKEYRGWVDEVYKEDPGSPCQLQDILVFPRLLVARSKEDLQKPEQIAVNTNGLILDSIAEVTSLTIQQNLRACAEKEYKLAVLSQHAGIGLANILLLLQKMGEGKVRWKSSRWEKSTDGFQVFQDTIFTPNEIYSVYFTPGRDRLSIAWHSPNPHAPTSSSEEITICEIRLESSPHRSTLDLDIHVRVGRSTQNDPSVYSKADFVDLFDLIYGPNKHHIQIATGAYTDRLKWILEFMRRLNIEHIYKTTKDIPTKHSTHAK